MSSSIRFGKTVWWVLPKMLLCTIDRFQNAVFNEVMISIKDHFFIEWAFKFGAQFFMSKARHVWVVS